MDKKRALSLVLPTSSERTTDKKIRPSCSSSCSLPDVEPVLPTFVSGPFQRELYNAYEQYFRRHPMFVYGDSVQVRSVNIRDILWRLEDIIRTRDQCEEALARIPWVRFTPGQTQVEFFIEDNGEIKAMPENDFEQESTEGNIDDDDLEVIVSLIAYLDDPVDPWPEGCELCHLLDHWKGNSRFKGNGREYRFKQWVQQYCSVFPLEPYHEKKGKNTAVKWTGVYPMAEQSVEAEPAAADTGDEDEPNEHWTTYG